MFAIGGNSLIRRLKPTNKCASAGVVDDQGAVIEQGFEEAVRRDPEQRIRRVVLTDGGEELLRQMYAAARRHKVGIILVQDFVHASEYLWKYGHALYPEAAEGRENWVMIRTQSTLQGRARDFSMGLRRAASR